MFLQQHSPTGPLSAYIRCFWYSEGAPATHLKEKLLPNGEASIIINLREDPIRIYDAQDFRRYATYGGALLSGPRSNCFVIDSEQQERVFGIQFAPGGAFPFLRVPACEVGNVSLSLHEVWSDSDSLRQRLLEARDAACMFQLFEGEMTKRLRRMPSGHPAVTYARRQLQNAGGGTSIATISDRAGLSRRRLIELFRREVGLTPKVFHRVRRFQRVLQTVRRSSRIDRALVALDCGYYDQAHFIDDFQCFSGLTPGAYAAAATQHFNHVPLR